MKTQRGFVSAAVLIAIVLGLIVVGGGAYFVIHQTPTQTASENLDDVQTLPTTNNQTQPTTKTSAQTTPSPSTQKAAATIDKGSLSSNSSTPTITGTANADIGIFIAKGTVNVGATIDTDWHNYAWRYWGHLGKCQSTTRDVCGFDILGGRWSIKVFGPGFELKDGVYTVIITDSITGKDTANVLTTGMLTVKSTTATGLKTYTNTQYGFSVQYPSDVTYTLDNPGRFSNGSVSFSTGVNTGTQPWGRLDMGFPSSSDRCDVPKTDASHTAPTDLRYESIGGISFAAYTNTSAPPSATYIEKIYQGLRGSDCYFFVETVTSPSMSERTQVEAKLDAIVRSFHFN